MNTTGKKGPCHEKREVKCSGSDYAVLCPLVILYINFVLFNGQTKDSNIFLSLIFDKINNPEILKNILLDSKKADVKTDLISKIDDEKLLSKIAIEDEDKRQEELDKLNATQEEWKLRAMGTTIGCHTIVKKGTEDNSIKTYDLT